MSEKNKKIDRRRRKNREAIHQAIVAIVLEESLDAATMERIAEKADIARSTLYTFYSNREEIVESVLEELMNYAAEKSLKIAASGTVIDAFGRTLDLYFDLYSKYPMEMTLSYNVQKVRLKKLEPAHGLFMSELMKVFVDLKKEDRLRLGDPGRSLRALSIVALPTLNLVSELPEGRELFNEMVTGYLLK